MRSEPKSSASRLWAKSQAALLPHALQALGRQRGKEKPYSKEGQGSGPAQQCEHARPTTF